MTDEQIDVRKLAAIMHADVEGYSRLMGEDDSYTVLMLAECRKIFSDNVEKHGGRVVNAPGDSVLSEFPSVVSAVQSAAEIQKQLNEKNADLPENRKMQFRIGVNLGDVIKSGDDIHGDGVNIAARIQSLAEPGGVSISGTAFDSVRNKLGYGYEYKGEQKVKNIANPVRLYKILMDPDAAGKVIGEKRILGQTSRKVAITAILALAIIAGALTSYYIYLYQSGRIEPASTDKMVFTLPDKPSIAVMPLDNMSKDPQKEYFSDGLTTDIITALSKSRNLFVIARHSTFTFKGKPIDVKQIAEKLGVRYVLEGTVRIAEDRVRVTVELIDAIKGNQLWAERYDRNLHNIFTLQDEIAMQILTALQVKLTEGEKIRVLSRSTKNFNAYQKWQKGRALMVRFNIEDNFAGRKLLEEAVALDPNFSSGYVDLGWTHIMAIHLGSSKSPKESLARASQLARKAVTLDESSPFAQTFLGVILAVKKKHEEAIVQLEKAVALSPNYSLAQAQLGRTLGYAGRHEEALIWLEKAIRLDPIPMNWFLSMTAHCYLYMGRYEEALEKLQETLQRNPKDLTALIRMPVAYSLLGKKEKARAAAKEILKVNPKFKTKSIAKWPFKIEEERQFIVKALRDAGLE